jgi:predicted nucleic acid-binding protein
MKFLIDTSVWSEALRRKNKSINSSETILSRLILNESEIIIIGIILQEILSGITDIKLFNEINAILSDFPYDRVKNSSQIG